MLAQRLPGLLPPLDDAEALECAMLHSLARSLPPIAEWRRRPFRAPHHGASAAAVVGGGGRLRPGEISLAHHGVLFLDELPEYRRDVLEALREPLETGSVSIARSAWHGQFPARFQLVAAMNPCQCGYAGDANGRCRCTAPQVRRYLARISGPLLDRIDLHVEVPRLAYAALAPAARLRSRALLSRRASGRRAAVRKRAARSTRRSTRGCSAMPAASACASTACSTPRPGGSDFRRAPAIGSCASRARSRTSQACEASASAELSEAIGYQAARSRAADGDRLAALRHHVFDRGLDGVVGQVEASALRRHDAGCALEARRAHAFSSVAMPCAMRGAQAALSPTLRRARDSRSMAGHAGRFEDGLAVRRRRLRRAPPGPAILQSLRSTSAALSCARDRNLAEGLDPLVRRGLHQRIVGVPGAFRAAVHHARNADQDQRNRDQDAEHGAENVLEMTVGFRHA